MSTTRLKELHAQLTAATDAVSLDPPEPTLTASGVERGRALYDRRSPDPESDALGRSRRTRRSTERGLAWAEDIKQSKALSAKIRQTKERKARRNSKSACGSDSERDEVGSQSATQAATQDGEEPGAESQYETVAFISREMLLEKLAKKIDFDCTDLSTEEILDLLDAPGLSDDQTAPMETEDNNIETVVLPSTRVSVGGGFHLNHHATNDPGPVNPNILPAPGSSNRPINPPAENTDTETETEDDDPLPPRSSKNPPSKRGPSPLKSQLLSKRSRIASAENSDTETEVEEIPPYQVPRARVSTGTVIPDSQPGSPRPSTHPRTYAGSRSFVQSDSNTQPSQRVSDSQRDPGRAVSATSSLSLGAPLPGTGRPASGNLDTLSRLSSVSLGGSIPTFGAQPREPPLHPSESQPPPRRESQASSQANPRAVSHDAAPKSGATALSSGVRSSGQTVQGAVAPNAKVSKPISKPRVDMVADTRERLDKLISVVIGRKEPSRKNGATGSRDGRESANGAATTSTQPTPRGDVMPDDEDERQISAARAKGKRVRRRKKKALTSDLEGRARQVIVVAKLLLFAYVVVFGPYLTRETYLVWAPLIYELAWYREFPELPFELPPKGAYDVMVDNLPALKGCVKLALRTVVKESFKLCRPALTPEKVQKNLTVMRDIYPNWYHCTDPKARKGHYLGQIMEDAISAAFFSGPQAIGILFHELFDPIPIPTICYILTNLQFCVEEWTSGHFKGTDLSQGNMLEKYLCHVTNIKNFRDVADDRLWAQRQVWFKHAVAFSGTSQTNNVESSKFIINKSEFRPDSPQPQSQSQHVPEDRPELESQWGEEGQSAA